MPNSQSVQKKSPKKEKRKTMPDTQRYTQRELDHYFSELKEDVRIIKEQTLRTNGRVNKLENWRWLLTGGMTIITMLVIPLIVYIWNTQNSSSIEAGIQKALSAYELSVEK